MPLAAKTVEAFVRGRERERRVAMKIVEECDVCPVDCIVADVLHDESRGEVQAKYARLHGL